MTTNAHVADLLQRFADRRLWMIETQIAARGIRDARVLEAMRAVPRELFVPPERTDQAYDDCALPIGPGQTISQPYIVAYMTAELSPAPDDDVLEIGTGTGYQCAVLARLARTVYSVERDAALSAAAGERLARLGVTNAHLHVGDGSVGLPAYAPFGRILVTAGCPDVPAALVNQLTVGGVLVLPVGDLESQVLVRVCKRPSGTTESALIACRFVKLVGRCGWPS